MLHTKSSRERSVSKVRVTLIRDATRAIVRTRLIFDSLLPDFIQFTRSFKAENCVPAIAREIFNRLSVN